jgi:hypothetical protein
LENNEDVAREIWNDNNSFDCEVISMSDFEELTQNNSLQTICEAFSNGGEFDFYDEYFTFDGYTLRSGSLFDLIDINELAAEIVEKPEDFIECYSNGLDEILKEKETEISKTITKIYVWENDTNKAVAEVIENCGCGFDWLIRVNEEHKHDLVIINKCLSVLHTVVVGIDEAKINEWIEKGYVTNHETMAFIVDEVI